MILSSDLMGKIYAISCALIWAFAVILFKRSGETIHPSALNLYKTVIASLLFIPLLILNDTAFFPPDIPLRDYLLLCMSGFFGIAVADSLFFRSLNAIGAGLSAIVDCLYSIFVITLSAVFLESVIGWKQAVGGCLVISAILVGTLRCEKTNQPSRQLVFGILTGAAAMLCSAISIVIMHPIIERADILWVTEVRLLTAALILLPLNLSQKTSRSRLQPILTVRSFRYAFPATVLGNGLSLIVWVAGFKYTDVNSAAILNQTSTIFIVILASIFLNEVFTQRRMLATLLAFSGSILVMTG